MRKYWILLCGVIAFVAGALALSRLASPTVTSIASIVFISFLAITMFGLYDRHYREART